jgi:hypothetical protein
MKKDEVVGSVSALLALAERELASAFGLRVWERP